MRRLLALILIAVLAFAVVGCTTTESTDDATDGTTEEREGPTVRMGSMLDAEGTILGAMVLQMLEANGIPTEDMTKLIHKYVYVDRPFEKAAGPIRNGAMRINANAALNMASVQDQLSWFQSEGLVKDSITTDTLVDSSYVKVTS